MDFKYRAEQDLTSRVYTEQNGGQVLAPKSYDKPPKVLILNEEGKFEIRQHRPLAACSKHVSKKVTMLAFRKCESMGPGELWKKNEVVQKVNFDRMSVVGKSHEFENSTASPPCGV